MRPGDILFREIEDGYQIELMTEDQTYFWKIKSKSELKRLLINLEKNFGAFEIVSIPGEKPKRCLKKRRTR